MKETATLVITIVCLVIVVVIAATLLPAFSASGDSGGRSAPIVRSGPGSDAPTRELSATTLGKDEIEVRAVADDIVSHFANGEVSDAFSLMRQHSPLPEQDIQAAEDTTVQQLKMLSPRFGRIVGHEFIRSETAGESLIRLIYIVKHEKHILRWRFIFYRPNDKWLLNNFKWDDQINRVFSPEDRSTASVNQ